MARKKPKQQENQIPKKEQQFRIEFKNAAQKMAWNTLNQHDVTFLLGSPGSGKSHLACAYAISEILADRREKIILTRPIVEAGGEHLGFLPGPQPLTAKILTPTGWTTMGELKVGDFVMGRDGKPTKIIDIFPKGKKMVYKITTSENTSTEACEDHLWLTHIHRGSKKGTVKTTKQIMESLLEGKLNHYLPRNEPVKFSKKNLPIPPYTLGALLCNGSITGNISLSCQDTEVISKVEEELQEVKLPIEKILANLGLRGSIKNRFIPEKYKYSSIKDRIDLLRGLMDTNGRVDRVHALFATLSKQLANDVIELVQSLGGRAVLREKDNIYEFNISLPSDINPFFIPRKAEKLSTKYVQKISIKSIEPVCEKECQCILVENPEHLYITDQYIVTHNTFEEKIHPYMLPMYDCIDRCIGRTGPLRDKIHKSIELAPLAFLRGRSLHNSICIFDEAQNATEMQLKLFMTRFGDNSKIVITGDPMQSDLRPQDQALMSVVKKLENLTGIGIINFKSGSIVRHPLIAAILGRLEAKEAASGTRSN